MHLRGESSSQKYCFTLTFLQLEDETTLYPSRLLAMDSNNSAKRLKGAGLADPREFQNDYFLSREDVDKFQNKVKQHMRAPKAPGKKLFTSQMNSIEYGNEHNTAIADALWITVDEPGEAADGEDKVTPCTENWKASAEENNKKSLAVYDSTGIFPSACRHGFMLKAVEMVESGEL